MHEKTLYLKIDENVEVHQKEIFLSDIASILCTDSRIEKKLKKIKVLKLEKDIQSKYIVSILNIISVIHEFYPHLIIHNLGATDFIVIYEKEKGAHRVQSWLKTIIVCVLVFLGSSFSIMTFNNDVDIPTLFAKLYYQVTGEISNGFTILEFSYSLGVGLGVIIFFNHLGKKKFSLEPTPMEVEMRTYEENVNNTLIKKRDREGTIQNGDS
jgi:Stage V sporulation protein AA.